MISANFRRSNTIRARLDDAKRRLETKVVKGMKEVGEKLKELSLSIVPRDTQTLANDAHVRTEGSGFGMMVIVGYGTKGVVVREWSYHEGKNVIRIPWNYAVNVHENPQGHSFQVGHEQFLREPIYEEMDLLRMAFRSAVK